MNKKTIILFVVLSLFVLMIPAPSSQASGGSNKLSIGRYSFLYSDPYQQVDITYVRMESDFKVYGDGSNHYFLQGPTLDTENLWDPNGSVAESIIDKGAVKGTSLRDLCDYIGGCGPDDLVVVESSDLSYRTFGYEDIYQPEKEQGTIVIVWYKDGEYSPSMEEGMHLCVMPKTANATGQFFFGNTDMKKYLREQSWVYYEKEDQLFPGSNGIALNDIRKIKIYHIDQQILGYYTRANPPNLVVSSFTAQPEEVYPGEEVTITAVIKNNGSYEGIFSPLFYVDGKEERCIPVKIDTGETREVSFTICREIPDEYDLRFDFSHTSFTVIEKRDIDKSGTFTRTVSYKTSDETAELACPQGTTVRTREGSPLTEINIGKAVGMPPVPDDTIPVSIGYDLSPDGACFNRKVSLTVPYSEDVLPPGVSEADLVIGCFQSDSQEWELIDDVTVDTAVNTITAEIDHFSVYAVFAEEKEEANISPDNLTIEPVSDQADETITANEVPEELEDADPEEAAEPETTVTDTDEVPLTSEEEPDDAEKTGFPMIPVIIGMIVIIMIVIFILMRKKASTGQ